MKRPIFVRPLSDAERETLEAGLRSADAFTLRRCQILLASARGENAYQIARSLGCNPQTVRNAIHAFNERGVPEALRQGSKRPHTVHRAFDPEQAEALRELLHQKPRNFGKDSSLWTLGLAAKVSFLEGLSEEHITGETVRATLARMGVRWERAKRWITSPDPQYARKKAARPIDPPGRRSLRVGRRFLGRDLVQQASATGPQQLERCRRAPAPHRTIGRQGRPRSEGHLLLRALCA